VRAADTKSVAALGAEIAALAEAARSGTLAGADMVDASFTVTSLGRWGVEAFTPVISAPQVAILGVGAVDRVAREAPDGSVRFRSELTLCLVFDHRANDGVAAAEFLATIVSGLAEETH
jgi:pyruvate dehydrogenase E2 component (dihydrolipoamide acetyltransferase)